MDPLEPLGFALAGYGCTTCIGNSGPLDEPIAKAIEENDLVVAAVLSGNRNFEGRIHPLARASYLASPPLVVAFALAGRVDIDLTTEPLGTGIGRAAGHARRRLALARGDPAGHRQLDRSRSSSGATYAVVFDGDERWRALPIPAGDRYDWNRALDVHRQAAVLRRADRRAGAGRGHRRRPRPRRPRRLDHDRPHLAGRLDRARGRRPGDWLQERGVAPARVQLVRRPARPPRGDDARHVREHPPPQRPRPGQGRPVHGPPPGRRGAVHLRRGDALPARGHAARRPRRAANTAPARRATGRPRARCSSGSGR